MYYLFLLFLNFSRKRTEILVSFRFWSYGLQAEECPHPFCPASPLRVFEPNSEDNMCVICFAVIRKNHQKRDNIIYSYRSCLRLRGSDTFECVKNGGCLYLDVHWDLRCKIQYRSTIFFYYVICEFEMWQFQYNCKFLHKSSKLPTCCDFICP